MNSFSVVIVILAVVTSTYADMYMHNPRGSNDRNCERNTNRNNGNRLFDSQNNDKGGYACPRPVSNVQLPKEQVMYYYEGSKLQLEWTNQHGCGTQDDTYCQIIIQYMCEDENPAIRDGTPNDDQDAATDRMDADDVTNQRYGYHETYPYYQRCSTRDRNYGLYTADQNVNQDSAIASRQNPNGDRDGWECQEERDYYPYWHPSPWKDVAIISSDFGSYIPSCEWYQKQSQNNMRVGECFTKGSETALDVKDPTPDITDSTGVTPMRYNNEADCDSNGGYWYTAPPKGGGNPDCQSMTGVRPNSLGNDPATGYMFNYVWTIPSLNQASAKDKDYGMQCVLRFRYNISSADIPFNLDYTANNNNDPDQWTGPNQDPYTQPFEPFTAPAGENIPMSSMAGAYNLSLALNTDQYGRTFQDRSYVFYIRSRGSKMGTSKAKSGTTIWNLNVRGKRGNIVQTFPAMEYDFVPQVLNTVQGDYVHIQWTGSDYNPDTQPNNGEGGPEDIANSNTYRADRSNMVQLKDNDPAQNLPNDYDVKNNSGPTFFSKNQARLMAFLNQDPDTDCDDYATLLQNNANNQDQADKDSRNCYKLNAQATPYFDGGLVQTSNMGTFHLYSTRNNNFSNRSQKVQINVGRSGLSPGAAAGVAVASITGATGAAAVGGFHYAKKNPGSRVAGFYNSVMTHPYLARFQ